MSRIGKKPIEIPKDAEVKIDGSQITVKGPKGELSWIVPVQIEVSLVNKKDESKEIQVDSRKKTKDNFALWGLTRALISNMIEGATKGFEKRLEIEGVGYRAAVQDNKLVLNIGLSHSVEIEAPKGIEFKVEKNIIIVSGIDKQLVGQMAAEIRAQKKPEPYKGKGIKYLGEVIRRKAGKKAVGAE